MRADLEQAYSSAPPAKLIKTPDLDAVLAVVPEDEITSCVLKCSAAEQAPNGRLTAARSCVAVVTNRSIYLVKQGMNFKSMGQGSESIPPHTISGISLKKGVLTAGLEITRAGNSDRLLNYDYGHAEKWVIAARALLDSAPSISGNTTNIIQQVDPLDQLKKLKDLLDAGILTQAEFDSKKQEIMDKI